MKNRTPFWLCVANAVAVGIAVEMLIGGWREAWDVDSYWSLGLPLMYCAAFGCGFVARSRPVAIGYAPFAGQLIAMLVKTGAGSMIGLGLILLSVLGAAGVAAAKVGEALGRRVW